MDRLEVIQESRKHGGARKGAGRKHGSATTKTREIADKLIESGEVTPLEYLLSVMRDPGAEDKRRDAAAISAAPYIHPRLQAIEHSGAVKLDLAGELAALNARVK